MNEQMVKRLCISRHYRLTCPKCCKLWYEEIPGTHWAIFSCGSCGSKEVTFVDLREEAEKREPPRDGNTTKA
jgi:hypothetical protein